MEFKIQIFQAWKVMKFGLGPGKSHNVMESKPNGCRISSPWTFSALTYIIIVHCQTQFDLLFNCIIVICVTYSVLYENLTCSISIRLSSPGKTWKMDTIGSEVPKNAHKKVLESHEKPLSVFCMHPVIPLQTFDSSI